MNVNTPPLRLLAVVVTTPVAFETFIVAAAAKPLTSTDVTAVPVTAFVITTLPEPVATNEVISVALMLLSSLR